MSYIIQIRDLPALKDLPYATVYTTPPWAELQWSISPQFGKVPVPNRSALEESRRELSGDVLFGIGTRLVVEQSTPWKTALRVLVL